MGSVVLGSVAFVVAGAVLAAWSVRRSVGALRRLRALGRASRERIDRVIGEPVAVVGRIVARDPVTSPVTERAGAWVRYLVDERRRVTHVMVPDAEGWAPAAYDEIAAPFALAAADGSRLPVDPEGAEVIAPSRELLSDDGRRRVTEAILQDGDEVIALGAIERRLVTDQIDLLYRESAHLPTLHSGRGRLLLGPVALVRRHVAARALGFALLAAVSSTVSLLAAAVAARASRAPSTLRPSCVPAPLDTIIAQ